MRAREQRGSLSSSLSSRHVGTACLHSKPSRACEREQDVSQYPVQPRLRHGVFVLTYLSQWTLERLFGGSSSSSDARQPSVRPNDAPFSNEISRNDTTMSTESLAESAHSARKRTPRQHEESGHGLERNIANIAGVLPAEGNMSNDQVPEHPSEHQDPMWLMAGLAERGWTLQKSWGGNQSSIKDRLLTSATLPVGE